MVKVTFHGHACFSVAGQSGRLIIDPFLTGNPAADVDPEEIDVDAVLLTHGHGDHLGDAVEISKNCNALIVAPYELAVFCQHKGAAVHPMHIGGSRKFDFGWIKLTPALHGSAFIESGSICYTGNPCGYVIDMDGTLIYHAGDTGLFGDMKLLGDLYKLDLALVPIGDNFVMGPSDAVIAVGMLRPRIVIPMHYDTFNLIKQDAGKFKEQVENETNTLCEVLQPGESLEV